MVFSSLHTRLTPTSSGLHLPSVLLPPSPILKADDLLISSTSGVIPILVGVTTHTCDSPPPRESPGLWNLNLEPTTTGGASHLIDEANWMDTAELQNNRHAQSPSDSFLVGEISHEVYPASSYYDFPGGDAGHPSTCSLSTLGKRCDSKQLRDSQTSCPNATALGSTTVVPKEDLDGDQHPAISTTFYTYSTLPTPTFAPPSPSPSADVDSPLSSPTSQQRHRRPLERARAVRLPGRPRSPRLQVNDVEAHLVRTTTPPPRWQVADSALIMSACATDTAQPFIKHVALSEELSWLQHMTIELWIDQEGFRAVRPCMQLIGYSPRTRSLQPFESIENTWSDVTAGVAEFMPTKREAFIFHYAALDGPPTLRMVSIAGDESRDYISRQATLSVKVNGVYTVLGTETFMASVLKSNVHGSRLQNVRLRWKFDYFVSDRKVDGTGKILPGEKTLTPLTFSCSPYLLHPLQGKKAGLMHIMRKNLVPKLASQKLEPPTYYASSHSILSRASCQRDVAIHARSHSDAFAIGTPLDNGVGVGGMDRAQRARRRRASSAGEDSLTLTGLRNELITPRKVLPSPAFFPNDI